MKFKNFEIHASPFIINAYCRCGGTLKEVPNGWFSIALFCPKCESIYVPKLVKMPRKQINKEYLNELKEKYKDDKTKRNK
jgi:thiol-disulfide isomerase/thioredoxin